MPRVFAAIWPVPAVQAQLYRLAADLHRQLGGRVMRAESLHLTLAFIGEVAAAQMPMAASALAAAAARTPRFSFSVDSTGYFRPGIVWGGPQVAPAILTELADGVRAALGAAAIPFDPKPFVAHVTLLRNVRGASHAAAADLDLAPIVWAVDAVALVESVPDARAHRYVVRARAALAG